MADRLTREQIALSTIVSEALMAKGREVKSIADRADVIVHHMLAEPEVVLRALGLERIGHAFERKADLPCDCPEGTSWDPHYTCKVCGSYDSHAIHGAEYRSWREG